MLTMSLSLSLIRHVNLHNNIDETWPTSSLPSPLPFVADVDLICSNLGRCVLCFCRLCHPTSQSERPLCTGEIGF